jgi:hypothetical protein
MDPIRFSCSKIIFKTKRFNRIVPYSIIGFSTQFNHDKIDKEDEKKKTVIML